MSDIPDEVIADLLSRLPPETLLRFRCVSKSWRALIDSPSFIQMHLNRSNQTHFCTQVILDEVNPFHSVSFDSLNNAENPHVAATSLRLPEGVSPSTQIVGCYNGLVLFCESNSDYVLWNPSTRKHHRLPELKLDPLPSGWTYSIFAKGFGFDSVNDDYKFVRISIEYAHHGEDVYYYKPHIVALVYSLKLNSWKKVSNFPCAFDVNETNGVPAYDALHWITYSPESKWAIFAFSCVTEKCRLLPLPTQLNERSNERNFAYILGFLKGCLSLSLMTSWVDSYNVWLMMDYGVGKSWFKTFSIATGDHFHLNIFHCLTFSTDESHVLLVQDWRKLFWYDVGKETLREVRIHGGECSTNPYICVGSLVQLGG